MSNFLCYRRMGKRHPKPPVVYEKPLRTTTHHHGPPPDEFLVVDTHDPIPHAVDTHPHHAHHSHHTHDPHEKIEPLPPGVHVHRPPHPPQEKHYLAHHHFNHHNREVDEENIYYTKHPIPKVDRAQHPRAIYHNYE